MHATINRTMSECPVIDQNTICLLTGFYDKHPYFVDHQCFFSEACVFASKEMVLCWPYKMFSHFEWSLLQK